MTAKPCEIHARHEPHSHVNEVHHVFPLGDGGPDVPANKRVLCATGHNNVHHLLDEYRHAGGEPSWDVLKHYTYHERELAAQGWAAIQAAAEKEKSTNGEG